MKFLIRLVLWAAVSTSAAETQACRFGKCRVCRSKVSAVVKHFDQPDVFVVQNNYPHPLVAQGTTLTQSVGYQAAVLPFLDPNRYFSQEQNLIKAASDAQALRVQRSLETFGRVADLQAPAMRQIANGKAASMVLQAAGLNPGHNTAQSQAVVISRDKNGQLQVLPLSAEQAQTINNGSAGRGLPDKEIRPAAGLLGQYCSKCHGVGMAEPKGEFFLGDDAAVAEGMRGKFFNITQMLTSGKMPPKTAPQPSNEQKALILDEIQNVILKHLDSKGESP